jgi:hypothetical protein
MRTLLILIFCGCGAASLGAQWFVGSELATLRYGGSAHDTSGTHTASDGRPGGGVAVSLRVGRSWSRWAAALRISYSNTGFAVAGSGVSVTDKTTGRLFEVSPLVSAKVGGIGPSGAVWVEVGPALHLWDFDGEYRKRIGATAALVYEWPVVRKLTGAIRLEGMLSPSWFDAADVPPEFERHATWRYGVGLGLRYRLSGG